MRRRLLPLAAAIILVAAGMGVYNRFFHAPEVQAITPEVVDNHAPLPQTDEFTQLAQADPVAMLNRCLIRYQREVAGCRCVLEKEERIKGELKPREVIDLYVRGDVPESGSGRTHIEVLMKWRSGAQKIQVMGVSSTLQAALYLEDRSRDSMTTWRPDAKFLRELGSPVKSELAKGASRYCIRDAGPFRGMQRTYEAWKDRQAAGTFVAEYLGCKPVPQLDGVECHIVKRMCRTQEVDPFAFEPNAKADGDPSKEGFSEVTIMVDAKRWLQLGTELRRANGELIGAYYFRNVELNPSFDPATFEKDGLLKK